MGIFAALGVGGKVFTAVKNATQQGGLVDRIANKNPGKGLFGGRIKAKIAEKISGKGGSAVSESAPASEPKNEPVPDMQKNLPWLIGGGIGLVGLIAWAVSAGGDKPKKRSYRR